MAKKKEKDSMEASEGVLVLSQRQGDIKLPDGRLLCYGKTVRVDEETADWLLLTFKGFLQRIAD